LAVLLTNDQDETQNCPVEFVINIVRAVLATYVPHGNVCNSVSSDEVSLKPYIVLQQRFNIVLTVFNLLPNLTSTFFFVLSFSFISAFFIKQRVIFMEMLSLLFFQLLFPFPQEGRFPSHRRNDHRLLLCQLRTRAPARTI
jgi:hypothetical protein